MHRARQYVKASTVRGVLQFNGDGADRRARRRRRAEMIWCRFATQDIESHRFSWAPLVNHLHIHHRMRPQHATSLSALRSRVSGTSSHAQWSSAFVRTSRPLATTSARGLPRSARPPKGARASTTTATIDPPPVAAEDAAEPPEEEGGEVPEGGDVPPTPSFPAIVTTLTTPGAPTEPLASEHHVLFNHLATSFVPANQPTAPPKDPNGRERQTLIAEGPRGVFLPQMSQAAEERRPSATGEDPVIALVSPFEGGDAYISRAVHDVAAHLSADVVRLDLALGVGFDGPFAPLAETGEC